MTHITNYFRKIYIYTKRHIDFLIVDILAYILAYYISVQLRQSMDWRRIHHGELFIIFGIVGLIVYLVVDYAIQNLDSILGRSIAREAEAVGVQMVVSWSVFTVILYLFEEGHEFSRAIYLSAFVTCFFTIFIARSLWKAILRYSRLHEKISPKLLIVCEATKAQKTINRLLHGSFENYYQISGVVMNKNGEPNYKDWYPSEVGLEKVDAFIGNARIQDAYVELDNADEESMVIKKLLNAGLIVHRSLCDSKFDYVSQYIGEIGGKSVITIEDTRISLASKVDRLIERYRSWRAKKKE